MRAMRARWCAALLFLAVPRSFCSPGARLVPREQLYVSEPQPQWFGNPPNEAAWDRNWLRSRFHFNFAEYDHGPRNFGVLRVMNDDEVQPRRGFGAHGHRDMEILTLVVQGRLSHEDSKGHSETLGRGGLQYMTAGSGITHSEQNFEEQRLRFVQCWVVPRHWGLTPRYGSLKDALQGARNSWSHVVSDVESDEVTPVKIHQDCNVHLVQLSAGSASFQVLPGRQGYLLCAEGAAQLNELILRQHDAAEVKGPLLLEAWADDALLLFFEMKESEDQRHDM